MKKKQILFIDDLILNHKKLQEINQNEEFEICSASSVIEAIEELSYKSFDLIISDLLMPDIDGFGLLELIKQNRNYCQIPVILLSSNCDWRLKAKCKELGADDFIYKPFTNSELIDAIKENLNN